MTRAAAIGSDLRLTGYALAGTTVIVADGDAQVARAIERLPDDVTLVILDRPPGDLPLSALERRTGTVWCSLPT